MKEFKITYEKRSCKNCNCIVFANSESEAWAKFILYKGNWKAKNVTVKERQLQ